MLYCSPGHLVPLVLQATGMRLLLCEIYVSGISWCNETLMHHANPHACSTMRCISLVYWRMCLCEALNRAAHDHVGMVGACGVLACTRMYVCS